MPSLRDLAQWLRIKVVIFVSPISPCGNQAGSFQNLKVLGNRLPGQAKPMFHHQATTDLIETLAVFLMKLVENQPARLCIKGMIDISHSDIICKFLLACQEGCILGWPIAGTRPGKGGEARLRGPFILRIHAGLAYNTAS